MFMYKANVMRESQDESLTTPLPAPPPSNHRYFTTSQRPFQMSIMFFFLQSWIWGLVWGWLSSLQQRHGGSDVAPPPQHTSFIPTPPPLPVWLHQSSQAKSYAFLPSTVIFFLFFFSSLWARPPGRGCCLKPYRGGRLKVCVCLV